MHILYLLCILLGLIDCGTILVFQFVKREKRTGHLQYIVILCETFELLRTRMAFKSLILSAVSSQAVNGMFCLFLIELSLSFLWCSSVVIDVLHWVGGWEIDSSSKTTLDLFQSFTGCGNYLASMSKVTFNHHWPFLNQFLRLLASWPTNSMLLLSLCLFISPQVFWTICHI